MDIDLLHPEPAAEKRMHKLKSRSGAAGWLACNLPGATPDHPRCGSENALKAAPPGVAPTRAVSGRGRAQITGNMTRNKLRLTGSARILARGSYAA